MVGYGVECGQAAACRGVVTMPNERPTLEALRVKFEKLDTKLKVSNEDHPLRRRLRRSLSWFERANSGELDDDVRYICLWISFNAAYSDDDRDTRDGVKERTRYKRYFSRLAEKDHSRIYNAFRCKEIRDSIFSMMKNKYVFRGFWDFLDDRWFNEDDWKKSSNGESFESDCRRVSELLGVGSQSGPMQTAFQKAGLSSSENTIHILDMLFQRLYVLRNQIMHGSATSHTWSDPNRSESHGRSTSTEAGSLNRSQVGDGVRILKFLVPLFLDVMMDHPEIKKEEYWGKLPYPVRFDIREDRRIRR